LKSTLEIFGLIDIQGYTYDSPLAGGQMSHSAIYKSKDADKAIVKYLFFPKNNTEIKLFRQEYKSLEKINSAYSDYIVKLLSPLIEHPKYPVYYFMTNYSEGITLTELIEKKGLPFTIDDSLDILKRISLALSYVNSLGIVHMDLHPRNIIIADSYSGADPGIRIIDYGLSSDYISSLFDGLNNRDTFRHMGAVSSWSPEYIKDPKSINMLHDIWALGIIVYRLITNEWAFPAKSFDEYYTSIKTGNFNTNLFEKINERLVTHLITRMFAVNPDDRIAGSRIVDMCNDYFNGTIKKIRGNEKLEELYYQNDGDIVCCSRCRKIVRPSGVMCPKCGYRDQEYLNFALGTI